MDSSPPPLPFIDLSPPDQSDQGYRGPFPFPEPGPPLYLKAFVFVFFGVLAFAIITSLAHDFYRKASKATRAIETTPLAWVDCVKTLHRQIPPRMNNREFQIAAAVDGPTMEKFFMELAQENPVRFTAQQLRSFTHNYTTVLGSGGFGTVYQGQFPNGGVKMAVKVLSNSGPNKNIEAQFMAEVGTIGRTRHINLVRLYGFCYDRTTSALVYEFMEKGSLDKHLFTDLSLPWEKLHEIAVGTAKGIAYLHEDCQQRIIHYDIKPGNVLLDANFQPKVADFGLAKLCDRDDTHVSNTGGYRGTPGYVAPEFLLRNAPITHKCDVYSFGIMLFEILGRRKNTRDGEQKSNDSLDWFPKKVWEEFEKGELMALTEACGIEEKDRVEAERMGMVALWCAQDSPETRPPMSAVVRMLEGGVEIMAPPKPFRYLFSVGTNVLKPSSTTGSSSYWYKETTPTMAKYEITVATL